MIFLSTSGINTLNADERPVLQQDAPFLLTLFFLGVFLSFCSPLELSADSVIFETRKPIQKNRTLQKRFRAVGETESTENVLAGAKIEDYVIIRK